MIVFGSCAAGDAVGEATARMAVARLNKNMSLL
jgi:hypothetical protein